MPPGSRRRKASMSSSRTSRQMCSWIRPDSSPGRPARIRRWKSLVCRRGSYGSTSARWARDVVQAPDALRPALHQLLDLVAIVPTTADAVALVDQHPEITAVTADGDVFGPGFARGGGAAGQSLLEIQSAIDETEGVLRAATARAEQARFGLATHEEQADAARSEVEAALVKRALISER